MYLIIYGGKDYIGISPSNITLQIGRVNDIFNKRSNDLCVALIQRNTKSMP